MKIDYIFLLFLKLMKTHTLYNAKRGSTWVCNFPHKARFHANQCV